MELKSRGKSQSNLTVTDITNEEIDTDNPYRILNPKEVEEFMNDGMPGENNDRIDARRSMVYGYQNDIPESHDIELAVANGMITEDTVIQAYMN